MREIQGYVRVDGTVGIRNHLLILSSVVCANFAVRKIAEGLPGALYATHEHGCGHSDERDLKQVMRTLIGTGKNPNIGACVVVGLGCEDVDAGVVAQAIQATGKPVSMLLIQKEGGTSATIKKGIEIGRTFLKLISETKRSPVPISNLILALECGGSDGTSGIASNPVLGRASDLLVEAGGTVILAETTEHIGAEHLMARRAVNDEVKKQYLGMVAKLEKQAKEAGISLTNLAPGNLEGGLTTSEEKSLGCILKGGTSELNQVLRYAERPTAKGLVVMDTPGFDVESVTGMAAGGAQIAAFTTGLGTPVGSPVIPVIKITGNPETAITMKEHIDVDVSGVFLGTLSIEEVGALLFEEILLVAGGKLTKAEEWGMLDFSITRIAPSY